MTAPTPAPVPAAHVWTPRAKAALILAILAFIAAFFIMPLAWILAIIAIVLGATTTCRPAKVWSIALSVAAILISILMIYVYGHVYFSHTNCEHEGSKTTCVTDTGGR